MNTINKILIIDIANDFKIKIDNYDVIKIKDIKNIYRSFYLLCIINTDVLISEEDIFYIKTLISSEVPLFLIYTGNSKNIYEEFLEYKNIDQLLKTPDNDKEFLFRVRSCINKFLNNLETKQILKEYINILNSSDIISKTDIYGNITYVNEQFVKISGYQAEELIGKSQSIVRHPDMPKKVFKELWSTIKNGKTFKGIIKNKKKDGSTYYVDATISAITDLQGNIKEYIGVRHDITDIMHPKKIFLEEIELLDNINIALIQIETYDLLIDFYGEKHINNLENNLLITIKNIISKELSNIKLYDLDNGTYGLIFFQEENNSIDYLYKLLENIKNKLNSLIYEFNNIKVDINFIISFTNIKDNAFEDLKLGLKEIKNKNGKKIIFSHNFHNKLIEKYKENIEMVNLIKKALNNDGASFVSYFQPIYNNKNNEIEKYESLIRLIKDDGTIISPYFFINIAKKAGFYTEITKKVIKNTIEILNKIDKDITINLSTLDIENKEIRDCLLDLITNPLYYGRITFELLEDEKAKDFQIVKDFISFSKEIGNVKIAIDDFGSGYSNYERLLDYQPDILKIDGSLIKNIVKDNFSKHIVESILLFAKKENILTVAEFVSDKDIFNIIKNMNIDYSQGFYLGKPILINK